MIICPECLYLYDNLNIPVICCVPMSLEPFEPVEHQYITDETVSLIEELVGHGSGAWDMVDPKEIIASVLTVLICANRDGKDQ